MTALGEAAGVDARLAEFRQAHPGVTIRQGEFGTWEGIVPEDDGETVVVRHTATALLGRLGEVLPAA